MWSPLLADFLIAPALRGRKRPQSHRNSCKRPPRRLRARGMFLRCGAAGFRSRPRGHPCRSRSCPTWRAQGRLHPVEPRIGENHRMILSIPDPECGRRKTLLSVKRALRACSLPAPVDCDPPDSAHDGHAASPDTLLASIAPYRLGLPWATRRQPQDEDKVPAWAGIAAVALPIMATLQAGGAA